MVHKIVAIIETIILLILVAMLIIYTINHGAPNPASWFTASP